MFSLQYLQPPYGRYHLNELDAVLADTTGVKILGMVYSFQLSNIETLIDKQRINASVVFPSFDVVHYGICKLNNQSVSTMLPQ